MCPIKKSPANPYLVMLAIIEERVKKYGVDQTESEMYGLALKVAKICDCYFESDSESYGFKNDTFYFWSKTLGDKRPKFN